MLYNAKLQVIKTVGIKKRGVLGLQEAFAAGLSFGLSGCIFSCEKSERARLSYGMAQLCSFEPNGLAGEFSNGN